MEHTKKRELWIDYCKVFLIYLMIVAHSGQISDEVDTFICSFHMPAFLLISGYLYKPYPNIRQSFMKNVKRLLVPALFFSVVCSLINDLHLYKAGQLSFETAVQQPLLGLVFYDRVMGHPACGVIWFVVVLFLSKMTLDVLFKYASLKVVTCLVLAAAVSASFIKEGNFTFFYYIERWLICLPIIYVGYILKLYRVFSSSSFVKYKYLIIGGGYNTPFDSVPIQWPGRHTLV